MQQQAAPSHRSSAAVVSWARLIAGCAVVALVVLSWAYFESQQEDCTPMPCDGIHELGVYIGGFYTAIIGLPLAWLLLASAVSRMWPDPSANRYFWGGAVVALGGAALVHGAIATLVIGFSENRSNGDLETVIAVVSVTCAVTFCAGAFGAAGPALRELH